MINSSTDIKIFIDEFKNEHKMQKLKVKFFEPNKGGEDEGSNSSDVDLVEEAEEVAKLEEDAKMVQDTFIQLFKGQIERMDMDFKANILNLLGKRQVYMRVVDLLNSIATPQKVKSEEALRDLGDLIKYMITVSMDDKHNDYKIIYAILHSSHMIFTIYKVPEGLPKKIYLTEIIKSHAIWNEIAKWKYWIYKIIEDKRREAK